jgi:hypothetical protein
MKLKTILPVVIALLAIGNLMAMVPERAYQPVPAEQKVGLFPFYIKNDLSKSLNDSVVFHSFMGDFEGFKGSTRPGANVAKILAGELPVTLKLEDPISKIKVEKTIDLADVTRAQSASTVGKDELGRAIRVFSLTALGINPLQFVPAQPRIIVSHLDKLVFENPIRWAQWMYVKIVDSSGKVLYDEPISGGQNTGKDAAKMFAQANWPLMITLIHPMTDRTAQKTITKDQALKAGALETEEWGPELFVVPFDKLGFDIVPLSPVRQPAGEEQKMRLYTEFERPIPAIIPVIGKIPPARPTTPAPIVKQAPPRPTRPAPQIPSVIVPAISKWPTRRAPLPPITSSEEVQEIIYPIE